MPFFPDDMERHAVFSDDGVYRYSLTRRWREDLPTLFVVMLNPSIASGMRDDPTVLAVQVFARNAHYGAITIGNLHALISSDPKALRRVADPVGPENCQTLCAMVDLALFEGSEILCAWGASLFIAKNIDLDFIQYARAKNVRLLTLGKTKSGAPRHPLYTPYSTKFTEF